MQHSIIVLVRNSTEREGGRKRERERGSSLIHYSIDRMERETDRESSAIQY